MKSFVVAAMAACLTAGCAQMGLTSKATAVANLAPTTGNTARGTVTFTQDGDEVRVRADGMCGWNLQPACYGAGPDHGDPIGPLDLDGELPEPAHPSCC